MIVDIKTQIFSFTKNQSLSNFIISLHTMSSEPLKSNSLYILLFGRDDPPFQPDYFHWALYIHREQGQKQQNNTGREQHQQDSNSSSNSSGTLHHAVCPKGVWLTKHEQLPNILNTEHLISALRIADIPTGLEDHVNRTLRTYDSRLDEISNISCMAWAFRILELLQEGGGENISSTVVKCTDLGALQKEMADCGNEVVANTAGDPGLLQPAVRVSSSCGFG